MNDYPLTLFYDGACPLCQAEMERLMRRNRHGRLRFVDAAAASFDAGQYGLARADFMRVLHAQCADGRMLRGVDAIRLAYRAAGFHLIATLLRMPGIRHLAEWLYPRIARRRYTLSRQLGGLLSGRRFPSHRDPTAPSKCTRCVDRD